MSGRWHRQTSIAAVVAAIVLALCGPLDVAAAQSLAPAPALTRIQAGACTQSCHAAFAQCYKDTGSNRRICEARLQQCLTSCINKR